MTAVTAEGNEVPLWVPSKERVAAHPITQFRAAASARAGR